MTSPILPWRHMIGGLIALTAGLAVQPTGPARADGMMPMRAIRQFDLGDMRVTVIDDGSFSMATGMFGSNAPKGAVGDRMKATARDGQMEPWRWRSHDQAHWPRSSFQCLAFYSCSPF